MLKPNHVRPDRYRSKSVQEKTRTQPTQTNKRRVLIETENEPVVSLGYIWPGLGAKAHRPAISPQDRGRKSVHKPTYYANLYYYYYSLLCRHSCLLHLGIPLIISSHTSTRVCISVVFNTTQDGRDCLSVSYSAPHEMAEFVSLY